VLVPVDLPPPDRLRHHWAVRAALHAAARGDDEISATGGRWVHHDGTGRWTELTVLAPDRAVLIGHDPGRSQTHFADATTPGGVAPTDLLAGLPEWVEQRFEQPVRGDRVGWIYAWDGIGWWRAPYDVDDGFDDVGFPARREDVLQQQIRAAARADADPDALIAAIVAGPSLTADELAAIADPAGDVERGVAAARRFAPDHPGGPPPAGIVARWDAACRKVVPVDGIDPPAGTTDPGAEPECSLTDEPPTGPPQPAERRGFWRRLFGG
jgi:hypothetical protein